MNIEKYLNYPLSDHDVMKLVHNKANIILYPEIYKYNTIDELLEPYGSAFILYEWKPNFGHWVTLNKIGDNTIEFFCSYGVIPDDHLGWVPKNFRKKSHQNFSYLTRLLYESPYNVDYNEYPFQKKGSGISTCGRWAGMRILLKDIPLKKFAKIFKHKNGDELVTLITYEMINK